MTPDHDQDLELVAQAIEGSKSALTSLIERHHGFVFNLALKMFGSPSDAEDVAQEVFVKVITSLSSFQQQSAFRTWLYRVTVNHVLNTRRRGLETPTADFGEFFDGIAAIPDEPWSHDDASVEELRLRCTSGMLMCLTREQRLTYILGGLFGVSHTVAAEVLGLSPGNYRVRLHRARTDLTSWMNQRCGLVNASNPCRCEKKTQHFVRQGLVDPAKRVFNTNFVTRIEALTRENAAEVLSEVDALHEREFLRHPYQQSSSTVVSELLGNSTLRRFFELNEAAPIEAV